MILSRNFVPVKGNSRWPKIGGHIDGVPFFQKEYEHLLGQSIEKFEVIKEWVDTELMPHMTRHSINENYTSYNLKHTAEKELGFYVCNSDIKYALLENDVPFKVDVNPSYPLSENFYKIRKKEN